ncbi:TetR family transcriptional regulator [Phycicoccus sp. BSK3Z-2]|uniref:TetR family transcriptional regulator n=1 Tax=Phycicoccus avicenniae TaxID=2828860 RepID=A0A941D8D3_9MICO|nr:TetR/AcrR family transcriptional regulator [Phycicoccus avicenniae]MBR7743999.1 TetR family transcriptional regulator [Phycicoccus avicenniae]
MSQTRDRILDAFRDQVSDDGVASATLEAVARRAGVSKGGLLYHFGSKRALVDGLAERLRESTRRNVDRAEEGDPVRVFLETSTPDEAEARDYWAVFAAVRAGGQDVGADTRRAVAEVFEVWGRLLGEAIDDPVTADLVRLAGDGLYLSAVTGLPVPDRPRIDAVVRRLIDAADG